MPPQLSITVLIFIFKVNCGFFNSAVIKIRKFNMGKHGNKYLSSRYINTAKK
jgi:hypothetical protein